jgi:two-component system heavy metal sensor histidine kinase CusS
MSLKLKTEGGADTSLRSRLAFRLTAAYSLAGLLLVVLGTASLYIVLRSELDKSIDLFLADKVHVVSTMLRERPEDEDGLREEIELESAARRYQQFYIQLLDQQGHPIMTTPGMEDQLDVTELAEKTRSSPEHSSKMAGKRGHSFRVTSARAQVGARTSQFDTVQVAVDISLEDALLSRYRMWFWAVLCFAFILFPVIGYQIARQGIRPVEQIAATARRITSTNLRERIESSGYPSELASLAETFNDMLERLEESFERVSRFSADIAHDLRTPVNNIRGEAEVALARARSADEYRDVLESSLEEAVRLSDLIGDLLFLARAEDPLKHLQRQRMDVAELLGTVREYYDSSALDSGIALNTSVGAEPISAELDRSLMLRAVSNLVSNAIAHTPRGGTVTLKAIADVDEVRIDVSDTGSGIPAEALSRVFDRFFRVDPSRSKSSGGSGLGLAIVQSIMTLHGGTAAVVSELGHGTTVTLRFHTPAK